MQRFLTGIRLAGPTLLVVWLAGCGSDPSALHPVRGQVFYRGVPVSSGMIVFTPDAGRGNHGPLAQAETQFDGSYLLKTGDKPGAAAGWYRVTIMALEAAPIAEPGQRFAVPRSLLPEKYQDPDLSELSCEVQQGKENKISFNLK